MIKFFPFFLLVTLTHGSCTNMLFFEHKQYEKSTSRSTSRIVSPGLGWKDYIIENGMGNELYDELNFEKYELMTHAYGMLNGCVIHRVCEKEINYTKYGKITKTKMRGYVVIVNDLFFTDKLLSENSFKTYHPLHSYIDFQRYRIYEKNETENKFKNKYPKYSFLKKISFYIIIAIAMYYAVPP